RSAVSERLEDFLYEDGGDRPRLQQRVVSVGLPWVEPDHVDEESPCRHPRMEPHESERRDDHEDGDHGVRKQNQAVAPAVLGANSLHAYDPCVSAAARPDHKLDLATREHALLAAQSAQYQEQTPTALRIKRNAAHGLQIDSVAGDKAGGDCGRSRRAL